MGAATGETTVYPYQLLEPGGNQNGHHQSSRYTGRTRRMLKNPGRISPLGLPFHVRHAASIALGSLIGVKIKQI